MRRVNWITRCCHLNNSQSISNPITTNPQTLSSGTTSSSPQVPFLNLIYYSPNHNRRFLLRHRCGFLQHRQTPTLGHDHEQGPQITIHGQNHPLSHQKPPPLAHHHPRLQRHRPRIPTPSCTHIDARLAGDYLQHLYSAYRSRDSATSDMYRTKKNGHCLSLSTDYHYHEEDTVLYYTSHC